MSMNPPNWFVRFIAASAVLICTVFSVNLASAQDPDAEVELQKNQPVPESDDPASEDDSWRLELSANLEGGIGKEDCYNPKWFCEPLYAGGGAAFGLSPFPAISGGLRVGLWTYAESSDAVAMGLEARFRPVQLFQSWADYTGEEMHALVFGVRADMLVEQEDIWGDYRFLIGYEYVSDMGLFLRLELAPGLVTNGPKNQGSLGKNIALGGYL